MYVYLYIYIYIERNIGIETSSPFRLASHYFLLVPVRLTKKCAKKNPYTSVLVLVVLSREVV
jgi:hypothetical protein